jgi:hypothetical protein
MSALGRKIVNTGYAIGKKFANAGALGLKNLQVGARKASHTLSDINRVYDSKVGRDVRALVDLVPGGSYVTGLANEARDYSGVAQQALDRGRKALQKSDIVRTVKRGFV